MRNSLNEDEDSGAPGSKPAERKRGGSVPARLAEAPRGSSCRGNHSYSTLGYVLCSDSRAEYSLPSGHLVTAPDSAAEASVLGEFAQTPVPPPFKA